MINYKKVILFLLGAMIFAYATPGDSALYESFSPDVYPQWPEGWQRFSLDIGSNNFWERAAGGQSRTQPGHVICVGHNTIRNNDWMITRMVVPSSDSQNLRFWYRAHQAGTYESLEVWVSTTTQDPTGMTTRLDSFRFNNTAYALRTVNLGAFINMPIYIGFRCPGINGQRIRIDDITGPRYPALDVGLKEITFPNSNFVTTSPFTPTALVKNYGSTSPASNFSVACTVYNTAGSPVYQDLQSVAPLLPNTTTPVSFSQATLNVGDYNIVFRTLLSGDMEINNDRRAMQISVFSNGTEMLYDDGIPSLVLTPGYNNGYGVKFTPDSCPVSIYGAEFMLSHEANPCQPANNLFRVQVLADTGDSGMPGPILWESSYLIGNRGCWNFVPIPGVVIPTGSFYIFWIQAENNPNCVGLVRDVADEGYFPRIHWDYTAGVYTPADSSGDRMIRAITEPGGYIDAELVQIIQPTGTIDTISIMPRVMVKNNGTGIVDIPVKMTIARHSIQVYSQIATANNVSSNSTALLSFPILPLHRNDTGSYTIQVKTMLYFDQNPSNDMKTGSFMVRPGGGSSSETGWQTMALIPGGTTGKSPKNGSCMAGLKKTGNIYFLKASNTNDFLIYTPNINIGSWVADTMPFGSKETFDGKNPKKGAAIAGYENGKCLYILRGNNTQGFWKYQADTLGGILKGWYKMKEIPLGAKAPKDGSGLVAVTKAGADYIFAMKGSKTDEFYLYDIQNDLWLPKLKSPPMGTKLGYKAGSCLAYDGEWVYVLKGNYGDFFKYNVENDSWVQLKRYDHKLYISRLGKKKKVKDGAALVFYNNNVYMLKGGNTNEVWQYNIVQDSWSQMDSTWDIPTGSGKKVKGGGCMIMMPDYFYAAKGANTPEFYRHSLPTVQFAANPNNSSEAISGNNLILDNNWLMISPNPAKNKIVLTYNLPNDEAVTFKLYDLRGSLVKSHSAKPTKQGTIEIDAKGLPAGVYILRFNSGGTKVTKKIVLEK